MQQNTAKMSEALSNSIRQALKPLRLEKVILFGSYAWGQPTQDSDVDLYVVTQDDFMPSTWRQRRDIVRNVSRLLLDLRKQYAIDLIVHTKPMHQEFIDIKSSFAQQIMTEGTRVL